MALFICLFLYGIIFVVRMVKVSGKTSYTTFSFDPSGDFTDISTLVAPILSSVGAPPSWPFTLTSDFLSGAVGVTVTSPSSHPSVPEIISSSI